MARNSYDQPLELELEHWPGVTFRRERRSKHWAFILRFDGRERFVIYPDSPGDNYRGVRNAIRHVREELRTLGAVRGGG